MCPALLLVYLLLQPCKESTVCVCVCVCMCVCVCVCVHARARTSASTMSRVFFSHFQPYFLRQGLSLGPETSSARLAGLWLPGDLPDCTHKHTRPCLAFVHGFWESTQVLVLAKPGIYQWSHLPSSKKHPLQYIM